MDVNSVKTAIGAAASVEDVVTILKTANDNNIILETQYLKDLLARQSVQIEDKTGMTLFYSGGLQTDGNGGTVSIRDGGYQAWQIAESMGEHNSQIITIGQTDAYALLSSDEFYAALKSSTTDRNELNCIINGITENGIRTEPGLWDITSQRIAASAVGEVRTLTPFSLPDKVFAQTELPALLANDKVASIDGIARTDLLRLVNDRGGLGNADALDAARSAIAAQSWLQAQDLEIGRDSATGELRVGDRLFFNDNTGIAGSELSADVINRASVSELMGAMHDSQWEALRKGADYLDSIAALSALDPGADNLTQGEAWRLKAAASVNAKRDRIAAARQASGERLDESNTQTPAATTGKTAGIRTAGAGEALSGAAQDLERAQQALLESAAIEQAYRQAQAAYVQARHAQVERIEDRLESLIDRQQARLQQTQQSRPGLLAMPGAKRAWQSQQAQQQARLHALQGRLEAVREIKEGMGLLSPRIEELATRKLRAEHPRLTADWDALQEASRRRQIALRQQARERTQTQEPRPGRSPSRGFASGNA
jgi:hypothetical protein